MKITLNTYEQLMKQAADKLAECQMRNAELMKILVDLTPGGSEFVDDPQRCATHIRGRLDSLHGAMTMWAKRAKEAEAKTELLEDIRTALSNILHDLPAKRDWLDPDVEKFARLLLSEVDSEELAELESDIQRFENGEAGEFEIPEV